MRCVIVPGLRFIFLFVLCMYVLARPSTALAGDAKKDLGSLQKEHNELLKAIAKEMTRRYFAGQCELHVALDANRRALRSDLELLAGQKDRERVLRSTKTTAERILELAERRYRVGVVNEIDVQQARAFLLEISIEMLMLKKAPADEGGKRSPSDVDKLQGNGRVVTIAFEGKTLSDLAKNQWLDLDRLVKAAKQYKLPSCPADAVLVRYDTRPDGSDPASGSPSWALAFLVKGGKSKRRDEVLIGAFAYPASAFASWQIVDPNQFDVKTLDIDYSDPMVVIYCYERGWKKLAERLWDLYYDRDLAAAKQELALTAWSYWARDLSDPGTDWKERLPRLRVILELEPTAFSETHRRLLTSMRLTLESPSAKPGSIEEAVDKLLHVKMSAHYLEDNREFQKVAMRGFSLVPTLLDRLDDERLSRTVRSGINNFPAIRYRMRHLASDLLEMLAGRPLGPVWVRSRYGGTVSRPVAEEWWRVASSIGEEAYLVDNVLGTTSEQEWPHSLMLTLIAEKYPKRLPHIYRAMLAKRPNMAGIKVAEAIATSDLPREEKARLLLLGAKSDNVNHCCDALTQLHQLENKEYDSILADAIVKWDQVDGRHTRFVILAQKTANRQVWSALRRLSERAIPQIRLEMIESVRKREVGDATRRQQLHYLSHFLGDKSECDASMLGLNMLGLKTIEVRNAAAWQIATLLRHSVSPSPRWTALEWAVLRERAQEALKEWAK